MYGLSKSILRIAAEGWFFLLLLAMLGWFGVSGQHWWLLAVCVVTAVPLALFFHDMPRNIVAKPLGMLAPVDGVVSFRRECHDPWLGREAIRIGITIPWFANYLLRAPVEGEVVAIEGAPQTVSCVRTDEGDFVLLALARGSLLGARPIWAAFGERIGQGRLCGTRRLARVMDVYLPADCRVEVKMGQTLRCGETILATQLRRSA